MFKGKLINNKTMKRITYLYWSSLSNLNFKPFQDNKLTTLMKWSLLTRKYPELEKIIPKYLRTNKHKIDYKSTKGTTALMYAATYFKTFSTTKTIKTLIEHNADPNLKDSLGNNVLNRLIGTFSVKIYNILKYVIKKGGDLN